VDQVAANERFASMAGLAALAATLADGCRRSTAETLVLKAPDDSGREQLAADRSRDAPSAPQSSPCCAPNRARPSDPHAKPASAVTWVPTARAASSPERMTAESVVRWLEENASKPPAAPDALHPADAFPLATLSNPPSSTDSHLDSDDDAPGDEHGTLVPRVCIAALVHPPNIMGDPPATSHARRRSSSLAGASAPNRTDKKKQRAGRSDHILEEDRASDSEDSDNSGKTESDDLELDDMSGDGLEDDEETGLTGRDRRRRRRRKRRNTLLDQRIVPEVKLSREEAKLADQNMIQAMLVNALLIGLW
jgi:hypothetical protein